MRFFKSVYFDLFFIVLMVSGITCLLVSFDDPQSSGIGTRSFVRVDVNDTVNNSATLHNSVLTTAIAANQRVHIHYSLPVSAANGTPQFKFNVAVPAGSAVFNSAMRAYSGAGDSVVTVDVITASATQTAAVASTGNSYVAIDFDLTNGATAGNVILQWAQGTANNSNSILLAGAFADILKY